LNPHANDDNEIGGVQPDVLVGLRTKDGVDRQAVLLEAKLPEAVRMARTLRRTMPRSDSESQRIIDKP
jgi:hypothetical protein